MPKLKLKELDHYTFSYNLELKVRHINYGGHLGNDALVNILHEARMDMFKKLECSETDLGDGKTGIILADLAVNYKSQGYLFDNLTVFMQIDELNKSSFRLYYKILKDKRILALAENGIVAFDYETNKITRFPEIFINRVR